MGNGVLGAALLLILRAMLALLFALRDLGRTKMLIATAFGALGVVGLLYLLILVFSLPGLGEGYVASRVDAQRTTYITVASLVLSQISSTLVALVFLLSTWVVLTSASMLRGVFPKWLGYLGLVSGVGFFGVGVDLVFPTPGLDFLEALSILFIVWLLIVGYKLFKLGQPSRLVSKA